MKFYIKLHCGLLFIFYFCMMQSQDVVGSDTLQLSGLSSYLTWKNAALTLSVGGLAALGIYGAYHPEYFKQSLVAKPILLVQENQTKASSLPNDIVNPEGSILPVSENSLEQLFNQATDLKADSLEIATLVGGVAGVQSVASSGAHGVYGFVDAKIGLSAHNKPVDIILQKNPMWQAGKNIGSSGGIWTQAVKAGIQSGSKLVFPVVVMATAFGLGTANLGIIEKSSDLPFFKINAAQAQQSLDVLRSNLIP